jgi:hypothetical protein
VQSPAGAATAKVGCGHGVGSGGGLNFFQSVEGTVWHTGREGVGAGAKSMQTSATARNIRRLTDECTGLSSSVEATFLDAGIKENSPIIFLGIEEYNVTEECTLVSCSDGDAMEWWRE